jgi:hypothetical protein
MSAFQNLARQTAGVLSHYLDRFFFAGFEEVN